MKQWFQNGFLMMVDSDISIGWKAACLIFDILRVIFGGPFQLAIVLGISRLPNAVEMIIFSDIFRNLNLAYFVIYWYLLSCLIVFTWKKIKKK